MKQSVYIETTIVSYLTSRPSRDLVLAAHQQVTRDWWDVVVPDSYQPLVSQLVLDECAQGNPEIAERRLALVSELDVLTVDSRAVDLAEAYVKALGLPEAAGADALHIALAVVNKIDFLVTWNCKHIANGVTIHRLMEYNTDNGYYLTAICTPDELTEVRE